VCTGKEYVRNRQLAPASRQRSRRLQPHGSNFSRLRHTRGMCGSRGNEPSHPRRAEPSHSGSVQGTWRQLATLLRGSLVGAFATAEAGTRNPIRAARHEQITGTRALSSAWFW